VIFFSAHIFNAESCVTVCIIFFLLAQLKKQGIGMYALDNVYNAIVLNKILYALPVYFGYLTEAHKDMLRQVLKRAKRIGFASYVYDLDQLNDIFQDKLFRQLPV